MRFADSLRPVARIALAAGVTTGLLVPAAAQEGIRFRPVAHESGIDFVLANHPTSDKHLIETMAGGLAAFDSDLDGKTDIFFANGASLPSLRKTGPEHWNRLYRNAGGMRFEDMTRASGLQGRGYCTGAAAADYDNDGDVDLFVACMPSSQLYRNDGQGGFWEVTTEAGLTATHGWTIGAAWLDYDRDSNLDLFLVQYVQWSTQFDTYCGSREDEVRAYCDPSLFKGLPNRLYRNLGDGSFEDVSEESGIGAQTGKGMSAAVADYDLDGWPDIFVTNDKLPNFLFRNLGDGSFDQTALLSGAALQDHGMAVSAMGVDFNDFDNDGRPDIVFTALAGESFPVFRNLGSGSFRDATYRSNMGRLTHDQSGWGVGLVDFDNDGWKDIFTANSHVNDEIEHFEVTRYRLENTVFENTGDAAFRAVEQAGLDGAKAHRGAAFADFDGDGRVDAVVTALGERAELWRNITAPTGSWISLRLIGTASNRDGIGARIRLGVQYGHMTSSVGYVSSSHRPVHFGLGLASESPSVEITWPSGALQRLQGVPPGRTLTVVEP